MHTLSPTDLAHWQLERDRARCAERPWLLSHKLSRMSASPFAYLRGAAPLFYELLARAPSLRDGPAGEGWIVGDLHVENFGAYRVARLDPAKPEVVFGLNDFDEAAVAPWRYDLVRLTASVLLAGREVVFPGDKALAGDEVLSLATSMLDAWRAEVFDDEPTSARSEAVERMVGCVERRTRQELLDDRTALVKGKRVFVRGPRYRDLDASVVRSLTHAFAKYADALDERERPARECLAIEDMAFRIAGTGSLGGLRAAVLTRGKGEPDASWIFDMKSTGASAVEALDGAQSLQGARRAVEAMTKCLDARPRMVGAVEHEGHSFLVRRLAPQEDKLDLSRVEKAQLPSLARALGAVAGRAHRNGAERLPARWTKADLDAIVTRAIDVMAAHHGAWLALCAELRRSAPA